MNLDQLTGFEFSSSNHSHVASLQSAGFEETLVVEATILSLELYTQIQSQLTESSIITLGGVLGYSDCVGDKFKVLACHRILLCLFCFK
jgi:hypothetical protein